MFLIVRYPYAVGKDFRNGLLIDALFPSLTLTEVLTFRHLTVVDYPFHLISDTLSFPLLLYSMTASWHLTYR